MYGDWASIIGSSIIQWPLNLYISLHSSDWIVLLGLKLILYLNCPYTVSVGILMYLLAVDITLLSLLVFQFVCDLDIR